MARCSPSQQQKTKGELFKRFLIVGKNFTDMPLKMEVKQVTADQSAAGWHMKTRYECEQRFGKGAFEDEMLATAKNMGWS